MRIINIIYLVCILLNNSFAQSKNTDIRFHLGNNRFFPSMAENITGTTEIKGTRNLGYEVGISWERAMNETIHLAYGINAGLNTVNDHYAYNNSNGMVPESLGDKEFLIELETGFIGIPIRVEYDWNIDSKFSFQPYLSAQMFSYIPIEDYRSGVFDIPFGRTIWIERQYNGNGNSGYSIISPPRFSYDIGIGSEYMLNKNNVGIDVFLARGPKNVENSTFEALPYNPEIHTTGNLNINRNHFGIKLSYTIDRSN